MIAAEMLSTSDSYVASTPYIGSVRNLLWVDIKPTSITQPTANPWRRRLLAVAETVHAPVRRRLDELVALEYDWDGYGGVPPAPHSLHVADAISLAAAAYFGERGVPAEVMPIADGGIQLEWRGRHGELALNAAPDGSWSYLLIGHGPDGVRTYTERYGLTDDEAAALLGSFLRQ